MVLVDCTFATVVTVGVLEVWHRFVADTTLLPEQIGVPQEMQKDKKFHYIDDKIKHKIHIMKITKIPFLLCVWRSLVPLLLWTPFNILFLLPLLWWFKSITISKRLKDYVSLDFLFTVQGKLVSKHCCTRANGFVGSEWNHDFYFLKMKKVRLSPAPYGSAKYELRT